MFSWCSCFNHIIILPSTSTNPQRPSTPSHGDRPNATWRRRFAHCTVATQFVRCRRWNLSSPGMTEIFFPNETPSGKHGETPEKHGWPSFSPCYIPCSSKDVPEVPFENCPKNETFQQLHPWSTSPLQTVVLFLIESLGLPKRWADAGLMAS